MTWFGHKEVIQAITDNKLKDIEESVWRKKNKTKKQTTLPKEQS